jgi:tetratricopeptide (TPR) repeat protein
MIELKPTTASYARISYARQLIGDGDGAVEAMELAREAAVGRPEALAWAHVQLAEMHLSSDLDRAFAETEGALRAFPGYAPAYETRAHVYAARGDYDTAVKLQRRAVSTFATSHFVEALGDMELVRGNTREAQRQYARVRVLEDRFAAAGTRIAIERAKFDVDHGFRLREALALAREGHRQHPSVEGDDTLAWALARNGRCNEALRWSKRSMRLGVNDAEFAFHRGMIERCLGRSAEARTWFRRALALDPNFSHLWAPVARRLADDV